MQSNGIEALQNRVTVLGKHRNAVSPKNKVTLLPWGLSRREAFIQLAF